MKLIPYDLPEFENFAMHTYSARTPVIAWLVPNSTAQVLATSRY